MRVKHDPIFLLGQLKMISIVVPVGIRKTKAILGDSHDRYLFLKLIKYFMVRILYFFIFSFCFVATAFGESIQVETAQSPIQDHLSLIDDFAATQPILIKSYSMARYDHEINYIYAHIINDPNADLAMRLNKVSQYFLGRPYLFDALGEGPQGQFDQGPLYRTDVFDCMTFVETNLALAEAKNLPQFKKLIVQVRYAQGHANYPQRNHFVSVDWNPNNTTLGVFKNITANFSLPTKIAETKIDKSNWYRQASLSRLKQLAPLSKAKAQELLDSLRALGTKQKSEIGRIDYLPLAELFARQQNQLVPKQVFFTQIPSGAIIEIVRPDWNLQNKIGTHLNVQHMGFAVRTSQGLIFREASSVLGRVVDVPLVNYLRWVYVQNPESGIHIEVPLQISQ